MIWAWLLQFFFYTKKGYVVSIPNTDNSKYDLLVDDGKSIIKVQCKTTGFKTPSGVNSVELRTSGGNKSGSLPKKFITSEECDVVYVYCLDETSYEFPVEFIEGRGRLNLGKLCEQYKITA